MEKELTKDRRAECNEFLNEVRRALGAKELPLDQFSCNTSYLSKKAWVAMLKQMRVSLSVSQMHHLFDTLAEGGLDNRLHVSVIKDHLGGLDDLDCTELECQENKVDNQKEERAA